MDKVAMQQIKSLKRMALSAAKECAASMQENAWMSSGHMPAVTSP